MAFDLQLNASGVCDSIDDFREGIEFSLRTVSNHDPDEWIPVMYFAPVADKFEPYLQLSDEKSVMEGTTSGTFKLRGYTVPFVIQSNSETFYNFSFCRNDFFNDQSQLQFRWLYTSHHEVNNKETPADVIILDNITITAQNCTYSVSLLEYDGIE